MNITDVFGHSFNPAAHTALVKVLSKISMGEARLVSVY